MGLLGVFGSPDARKLALSANKLAEGYALPYIFKDVTMDGTTKLSSKDIAAMKDLLNQGKKMLTPNV